MQINRNNVVEIIKKCNLIPDKDYGQNFLLDENIQSKIVDLLDLKNDDNVLEIGPGLGSLSYYLSKYSCKKTLVDVDRRMIDFLKIYYRDKSDFEIVESDIRKHDVKNYNKILGNLPYNITTEIIIYLLANALNSRKIVLMCQSEAFAHFNDTTGKEYGPASILIHLLGDIKKELVVKPGSFYPCPKCSSTVFSISIKDEANFEKSYQVFLFSKKIFLNRRKTIYNNLNKLLSNSTLTKQILQKCNIEEQMRPEQIDYTKFETLYELTAELN